MGLFNYGDVTGNNKKGYIYNGLFSNSKATYQDALRAGNYDAAKAAYADENGGKELSLDQFKIESDAAGKGGIDWGMNGVGGVVSSIGGLGLGYLSYLDSHAANKKNLKLMDQQIAANKEAAARSKENYDGLHNNWGKVPTATV